MTIAPATKAVADAADQRLGRALAIRSGAHHGPTSGPGAGLRAGQSRHFAAGAGGRFPALLPAQPETLPADRHFGAGRLARARTGRRHRHPPRPAALPGLAQRRTGRRAGNARRILARRSGQLRDRLFVFIRGSADRRRHRDPPHCARLQRADVPHIHRDAGGRAVPRTDGGVDAADEAGRRHSRGADHHALSLRAWRAGAYRQAGDDRHFRHHETRLRRRGAGRRRRTAGVLGLRGHAAIGDRDREAGILHHALSRQHAGDGPEEHANLRLCEAA